MHVEERIQVPVSRKKAWEFLWQVERVARCLPGCKDVQEIVPEKSYKVAMEDAVGPYKVSFNLDAEVRERVPEQYVDLLVTGSDKRTATTAKVALRVSLEDDSPTTSALKVNADIDILGKIAALGGFVIKRKVNQVIGEFTRNIQTELSRDATGASHA